MDIKKLEMFLMGFMFGIIITIIVILHTVRMFL